MTNIILNKLNVIFLVLSALFSATFSTTYDMVVIAHDPLYDLVIDYCKWHTRKGLFVKIVKQSEIPAVKTTRPEDIKFYLTEMLLNGELYCGGSVLLVGDFTKDQPKIDGIDSYTIIDAYNYIGKYDSWYGTLIGNDFEPEVIVGRIPTSDHTEVKLIIEKLLNYQKTLEVKPGIIDVHEEVNRVILFAQHPGESSDNGRFLKNLVEIQLATYLNKPTFIMMANSNCNACATTNIVTATDVASQINKGVGLIIYAGHGGPSGLDGGFRTLDFAKLVNEFHNPIGLFATCLAGETFAKDWMKKTSRGIASIGSHVLTNGSSNDALRNALVQEFYNKAPYNFMQETNSKMFGELINNAKKVASHAEQAYYNNYCDPMMPVWSMNPREDLSLGITCVESSDKINIVVGKDALGANMCFTSTSDLNNTSKRIFISGVNTGVVKYDGVNFNVLNEFKKRKDKNGSSLPNDALDFNINDIRSRPGRILFATDKGVNVYYTKQESGKPYSYGLTQTLFTQSSISELKYNEKCYLFDLDQRKYFESGGDMWYDTYWICTEEGIIRYQHNGIASPDQLPGTGQYTGNFEFSVKYSLGELGLPSDVSFKSMYINPETHTIWIGTNYGLLTTTDQLIPMIEAIRFPPQLTWTTYSLSNNTPNFQSDVINCVTEYDGVLFVGTSSGLLKKVNTNWINVVDPNGALLSSEKINCMFVDAGNLWIGTSAGLIKYDGSIFTKYTVADGLQENEVKKIIADNGLWIVDNSGIKKYNIDGALLTCANSFFCSNEIKNISHMLDEIIFSIAENTAQDVTIAIDKKVFKGDKWCGVVTKKNKKPLIFGDEGDPTSITQIYKR